MIHTRPPRWGLLFLLVGTLLPGGGCERRPPRPAGEVRFARKTPPPPPAPVAAAPQSPDAPDPVYRTFVRPWLGRHGCLSGPCHSNFRGGGFMLKSNEPSDPADYKQVLARIDRKDPANSELLLKVTGKVRHIGGRNLREESCDYKRLLAWAGGQPDVKCSDEVPPDPARFAREVVPALEALGCVGCHGSDPQARVRFDLGGLKQTPALPELALRSIVATNPSMYMTWTNTVVHAATGDDGKHKVRHDPQSCAYRRLYGFVAGFPELSCQLPPDGKEAAAAQALPSFPGFVEHILPALGRRGCLEASCHGGGAGGMTLYTIPDGPEVHRHNYIAMLARVEDFAHPEKSTLLTTARNEEPHGGGQRLGGTDDCIDRLMETWLARKPLRACPPPTPPPFDRFVKEIQPVLDKMTCTQRKCHGERIEVFKLIAHPDAKGVLANYNAVIKQIDLDFMPFSGVQLRMREPCAYSVVGAWIMKKPRPSCEVHDPDPSVFPKVKDDEEPVHPKLAPGPPVPYRKT